MATAETNWLGFLPPDTDPDVFFLVKTEAGEHVEGFERSVGAHKIFLANISPVFKEMLFGPMKETGEVIEVKETFPEVFSSMLMFIYKPPGDDFTLKDIRCPQQLFELMTVADKYEILNMTALISEALGSLEISHDNLLFSATVAKNYRPLYEDVSKRLMLKCLKFITTMDTLTLISETKRNFPEATFDILQELRNVGNETFTLPGILDLVLHLAHKF